jgi:hypothetical protein
MIPIHGYSFLQAFHTSHGVVNIDYRHKDLVRWICGNREFYTGVYSLQKHAKREWHPGFTHGHTAWESEYLDRDHVSFGVVWNRFKQMAESNMRLMCLDQGVEYQIGWAATGARLYDEVFLIPGCDVPVILRRLRSGQFQLVGDAIVADAMKGEVWSRLGPEHTQQIEIV